jgi:hypothetical protein
MLWTVLVAGCGLLGRTAYNALVLAAGKDAVAGKRAGRDAVWVASPEDLEPRPACRGVADADHS